MDLHIVRFLRQGRSRLDVANQFSTANAIFAAIEREKCGVPMDESPCTIVSLGVGYGASEGRCL